MKTNKFIRWTLLTASCLTLTLALGACKDNDDAYDRPAVSVMQIDKTADGTTIIGSAEGTAKLRISSNRPWTATTALDWLSITPESGSAGDHEVTIRVLKNSTGATRQGQFAFRAGGQTIFYTIQQQSDGSSIITPGDKPSQPENPNQPSPGDITVDGTDLKNFIAKYDTGTSVTITADEVFKAVVITDAAGNNFVSNKNLVVQAGDSGIGIRLPQVVNTAWTSGTVLSINAKGGKVERYNDGSLQLNFATPPAITPTGERSTIPLSALEAAPEGAIVTVAGGVDGEVSIDEAEAASWVMAESGDPHVQTLASPSGKTLRVLERGEGINYTAGEGNPIEIMDMSFGVQLASLRELLTREGELAPGLHDLPREADDAVAAAALAALSLS